MQIDGVVFADPFANGAFLLFQIEAVFMDIGDQGNGLGKVNVDGFIGRKILVVGIRDLDRAVLDTGTTARAVIFYYVAGLFYQGDREVTRFTFHAVDFSIGENLYVGMPADLDQFR
jgi:hypothetical protein